jgi:hypothetical protein
MEIEEKLRRIAKISDVVTGYSSYGAMLCLIAIVVAMGLSADLFIVGSLGILCMLVSGFALLSDAIHDRAEETLGASRESASWEERWTKFFLKPLMRDIVNGLKWCLKAGGILLMLGIAGFVVLAMVGSVIVGIVIFIAIVVGFFGFAGSLFGRR